MSKCQHLPKINCDHVIIDIPVKTFPFFYKYNELNLMKSNKLHLIQIDDSSPHFQKYSELHFLKSSESNSKKFIGSNSKKFNQSYDVIIELNNIKINPFNIN